MALNRHVFLCIIAVCLFVVKVLLDLFGGNSPVDLIALGLAFGFGSLL
jgi:hypothetical protein